MHPTSTATHLVWTPPAPITVAILGSVRLTIHAQEIALRTGGKSEALLRNVALAHRNPLERTVLLDTLWPDEEPSSAGNALNTLTSEVNKWGRKASRSKQTSVMKLLCHEEGAYRFNVAAGVATDVEYFDAWRVEGLRRLHAGDVEGGIRYCQQALALYRGDIGGDSLAALLERERLRVARLDLLTALADHHVLQTDWSGALDYLHHLLTVEPCREDAHRQIMRCYVKLGRRGQALRQFQLCTELLQREFAAPPEPATVALFDQIRLNPTSVQI